MLLALVFGMNGCFLVSSFQIKPNILASLMGAFTACREYFEHFIGNWCKPAGGGRGVCGVVRCYGMAELSTVLGLLGITLWPNAHQPPFMCKLVVNFTQTAVAIKRKTTLLACTAPHFLR